MLLGDEIERERRSSREDQSQGAARERLLRALPGTDMSEGKMGDGFVMLAAAAEEEVSVVAGKAVVERAVPFWVGEMRWRFCRSSVENDSSTKFDSHSRSDKSSYGTQSALPDKGISVKLRQLRLPLNWSSPPET